MSLFSFLSCFSRSPINTLPNKLPTNSSVMIHKPLSSHATIIFIKHGPCQKGEDLCLTEASPCIARQALPSHQGHPCKPNRNDSNELETQHRVLQHCPPAHYLRGTAYLLPSMDYEMSFSWITRDPHLRLTRCQQLLTIAIPVIWPA